MIVIGGLGSIGGAIAGAVLITALPQILDQYADSLPLVSDARRRRPAAAQAARFLYGAAVVAVLIFAPRGLAGLVPPSGRPAPVRTTRSTHDPTKESTA